MDFENLNAILKKTDKGIEALKMRDSTLPHKSRVLLILIDGKKTLSEVMPQLTVNSELINRIKELFNAGFVAEVLQEVGNLHGANLQHSTTHAASPTALSNETKPEKSLQIAVKTTTKLLTNMLGPNADVLCLQLEKCKSKDEFNAKILEFRKIVSSMRSESLANEFVNNSAI